MKSNLKIVVAFDSFKESISAQEACKVAMEGIKESLPYNSTTIEIPLSDGGEGLVDCIREIIPTKQINIKVHNPLMEQINTSYAISIDGHRAYMEMAAASGLALIPKEKRDPLHTTTYGVGEMIIDAVKRGCKEIILGIGGSATCDAGEGMIKALVDNGYTIGNNLGCNIIVACDVTNPLYGKNGAAYIFAPQKGAKEEDLEILDKRLRDFANISIRRGVAKEESANIAGAGAAGGLGYALLTYLKATLHCGIEIVLNISNFDDIIKDADLVITGEGKSDQQTLMGKVPKGVLDRCKKYNIPIWLISGIIDDKSLSQNFTLVKSINENDNRELAQLIQPNVAKNNLKLCIKSLIQEYYKHLN